MSIKISSKLILAVVLLWLLAAAADVTSLYLGDTESTTSDWGWVWYKRLILIPYWVLVSLLALRYFGAHALTREHIVRQSIGIVLAIALVSFGWVCCISAAITSFVGQSWTSLVFGKGLAASLLYGASRGVLIAVAASAYCYYRRMNAREHERRELQLRLAQTELLLFRSQLEPHFLFNTLNSIAALIRLEQYEAAIQAVHQLSKLLRHVLEAGSQQQVPFAWEVAFTELYIQLQRLRFGEKLLVRFAPESIPRGIPVPIMLLQPLIENAINHGPLADAKPCEVFIDADHRGQRLRIEVRNAIGRSVGGRTVGVGLKNIEGRLRALYNEDFELTSRRADGVFTLRLEFPAVEVA